VAIVVVEVLTRGLLETDLVPIGASDGRPRGGLNPMNFKVGEEEEEGGV